MTKVTADISLSPLTTIMSPRRSNLEHFTRDTRSLPVGPAHVMRGRDAIYSQGCDARLLDMKHDRAIHDWCSSTEHLEMNNSWHEIPEATPNVERNKSRPFLCLADVLACLIPSGEGFTAFRECYRRRCESAHKLGVRHPVQVERKGRKSLEKERRLKSLPTR
ncbi:hypothetical protein ALC62_01594 [Cyphomyrmex costatus]|uniref:Uncharacterized protein n=1 Tax=Cyphomyrmex costatus TaxID=456900 RepID=A0A195D3B7_9HYME|nr:hypothetical protein ALC62_01594 [Cyphomyrmex costatus]